MSSLPRITIITPSFNQGKYLEQTILSILSQNYSNLEYIIIDGGSTDDSVEIIKKYEKYLKYWVSEKDKGQSDAINKGLVHATGDIFNWLNSDDYFAPNLLAEVAKSFSNDVDVVCGKVEFIYNDGTTRFSSAFPHSNDIRNVISSTKYLQPSTFYRYDFVKQINGVNPLLHYCMDFEMWLKYLFMYGLSKVRVNNNITVHYRIHESSKTFLYPALFNNDQIIIFISILSRYNSYVSEKFKYILKEYTFCTPHVLLEDHIIMESCARFFYDLTVALYGQRNFKLFDLYINVLDQNYLNYEQRIEVNKMKNRRRFVPSWVYHLAKHKFSVFG